MKYILINPVVKQMYPEDFLTKFLKENGYTQVYCEKDWVQIVRDKYKNILQDTKGTIIDMRCPMAVAVSSELLRENRQAVFPEIHPILIHCAKEISDREDLNGEEKVIITPCQSLADLGNSLRLKETHFYTWKSFLENIKQSLHLEKLEQTPIPMGYFTGINQSVWGLTGEEAIIKGLQSKKWKEYQLIEMLYCHEGCHNGDGI